MSAVIIICTRTQSRRLPGKATKKIAGVRAIDHILNRARNTGYPIVLALPERDGMDIEDMSGVVVYRGHDESPLHRMAAASDLFPDRHWIVRITHDDILIDPETIVRLVESCKMTNAGYGVTPGIIEGAGVEVIHRENLLSAAIKREEPTEFISYFVRGDHQPKPTCVAMQPRASIKRPYRLTMDYQADAVVLEAVMRAVGPDAPLDEVARYVDANQYLMKINRLPELSVYTCAYNAQEWIGTAMSSVMGTRSIDLEHVILDDCSTDETLTKASIFWQDRQRILVNESNKGLASSSNVALSECRGKYVMRLDADDHLLNVAFEEAFPRIRTMLQSGAQVVYPAYFEIGEGRIGSAKDPRSSHHAGGAVFDKSFLNELRFRDGIRHWDGLELYRRMVQVGAKIAYYDTPTWVYRQHEGSMSKSEPEKRAAVLREIGCEEDVI